MTSSDPEVRQIYEARSTREHSHNGSYPKFAASLGQVHVPASTNPALRNAWKPCVELKQLVSEVKHKGMVKGAQANSCKLGIGASGLRRIKTKDTKVAQERAEVLSTFEEAQEERRLNACIKKEHFSEWVKWGEMIQQDRDWNKVVKSQEDDLFWFNLAATEDVLPTPSVLKCWKQLSNPKCSLCHEKNSSLRHILCGCQVARAQGRQTQLLHLLEREEQRVGGEAITQCPLNGNTVTNGNFTPIVKSNHKSKKKTKKNSVG